MYLKLYYRFQKNKVILSLALLNSLRLLKNRRKKCKTIYIFFLYLKIKKKKNIYIYIFQFFAPKFGAFSNKGARGVSLGRPCF